jgi:nucleoside triphosphate pyrophosphatase
MRLVLASASPRRAELLQAAGFTFIIDPADLDEQMRPGEAAAAYVRRLAADRSAAVARRHAGEGTDLVVLGADTAVLVDGDVLGKPTSDDEAEDMLRRLSGRRHEVATGVSLRSGAHEVGRVERTAVWFSPMTSEDISWYVASGEGRDKAGGYAIQGLASRFVARIDGSYSNVVGLPVAAVQELLRALASGG